VWLSETELVDLTHRKKPGMQARALQDMGIPYYKRPDGTIVVLRRTLDAQKIQGHPLTEVGLPPARRVLVRPARKVATARE
jgi:hypothetical protein